MNNTWAGRRISSGIGRQVTTARAGPAQRPANRGASRAATGWSGLGEAAVAASRHATDMRVVTFRWLLLRGTCASAVLLLAAACTSGGDSPGAGSPTSAPATSPAPALALCQDVDKLNATAASLSPVKGTVRTSAEMKAAAQDIQSNLTHLGRRTEWQTQIDNLQAATTNMQTAADQLAATPGARGVASNARIAVARVNDAIRRLVTAVGVRCPSPSPTPTPTPTGVSSS